MTQPATRTAARDTLTPALNRMLDMAAFLVAWGAYLELLEGEGGEALRQDDAVMQHWENSQDVMIRAQRYLPGSIQRTFDPLMEDSTFQTLRAKYTLAAKTLKGSEQARVQAEFLSLMFTRLQAKPMILRDSFPKGQQPRVARTIASAAANGDPRGTLNMLATLQSLSSVKLYRNWIRRASALVGAEPSPTAILVNEAVAARELGAELREAAQAEETAVPGSQAALEASERRAAAQDALDQLVEESESPEVVQAAGMQAAIEGPVSYLTEIGQRLGHTPDQEQAMMAQGRAIIAAGAGSGKTRVLASKVAWHIQKGVPADAILATSFTRKSSAELVRRVREYGGVITEAAQEGFGTTHKIAGNLLNRHAQGFKRPNGYFGKTEGWKQTTLVRLAVEQVKMLHSSGRAPSAPEPRGFWEGASNSDQEAQELREQVERDNNAFANAVMGSINYFEWISKQHWSRSPKWSHVPRYLNFLYELADRRAYPADLSQSEKDLVNTVFSKSKSYGNPITYRVAAVVTKSAAPDEVDTQTITDQMEHEEKKRSSKLESYTYYGQPADQWFNLGLDLTRDDEGDQKKDIPLGEFKQYISIVKGMGLSPSQAWVGNEDEESDSTAAKVVLYAEDPKAAVYAAYEWLKGSNGEPTFASTGDMDDLLIDTVTALAKNPSLRKRVQNRYRVILVDEAQDLNQVQHNMFGLMAGYLDPDTLQPKPDKAMTAETFALIGDGKQAIYAFRGADPSEFIRKSDLTEGGDDFTTHILKMNFRSGEDIVQAANQLIAHNTRQGQQIPMVCDANTPVKGQGAVVTRQAETTQDAAAQVAAEIAARMGEGLDPEYDSARGRGGYSNYGVALRSNAEAFAYGVEMLKLGIPFKSNARFFNDKTSKALIGWLTLAEGGTADQMNEALLNALTAPLTKVSKKTMAEKLENLASGQVWATWLQNPQNLRRVYGFRGMNERLSAFMANVQAAMDFTGTSTKVLGQILLLKGLDGASFKETLLDMVKEDGDIMAELEAESEGPVSEELIEERAMAPIEPLLSLLGTKDELPEAMNFVRKLQRVNEKISSRDSDQELDRDAVTIGTMHSWKGLECPTMYVPMVGGRFPRTGQEGVAPEGQDLWNARRLAYVAITRAEDRCVLLDIPHPKHGYSSQFFDEMCVPAEDTQPTPVPTREASISDMDAQQLIQSLLELPDPESEEEVMTDPAARLAKVWFQAEA